MAQTVTAAEVHLSLARTASSRLEAERLLQSATDLLRQAARETRALMFELSPPLLLSAGLCPALRWLVGHPPFDEMQIDLRTEGDEPACDDACRTAAFRAIQELLRNAQKHAQAHCAGIVVEWNHQSVKIVVSDDGLGFLLADAQPDTEHLTRFGLYSIRAQVESLGGELQIETSPGAGTRATVLLPLRPVE